MLIGSLAAVKVGQIKELIGFGKAAAAAGPPPEVIGTMEAKAELWDDRLSSVGTVAPTRGVTVSSEMAGTVKTIHFDSGQKVRKGQILVELDRSVEAAELGSAQEREHLARINEERSRALFKGHATTQAQVDNDESALRSAVADVSSLKAQIERKVVRAPFAGRLGIRMVNLGQYLTPGTPVTELESAETDFVDFTLPQEQIHRLKVGMQVVINEGTSGPHGEATISAIEPLVDPVTRSGQVRAAVKKMEPPPSPGMFVNVQVILPEKRTVTVVGATAIVRASYGDSVFVVEDKRENGHIVTGPDGKPILVARQQFVKTGEARGDFVEILQGVQPGQTVVSEGAFKLRNGMKVAVNNSVRLHPELVPSVENR